MGDYMEVRRSAIGGPEAQNLLIAGDERQYLVGHVTVDERGALTVRDTGSNFPYTTHASTINRYYEEHRDKLKVVMKLRDEPETGVPPLSNDDVQNRITRAHRTLHEGVHQTLLQLIQTMHQQILKNEVLAAQRTVIEATPTEWQAYIHARGGNSTGGHHIQSQLAQLQLEITQLDFFHVALEGHRATIKGIENKALQKSDRQIANELALKTFHNDMLPILQNDRTISESIKRRAQLVEQDTTATDQLDKEIKEVEDDPTLDTAQKRTACDTLRHVEMKEYNEQWRTNIQHRQLWTRWGKGTRTSPRTSSLGQIRSMNAQKTTIAGSVTRMPFGNTSTAGGDTKGCNAMCT